MPGMEVVDRDHSPGMTKAGGEDPDLPLAVGDHRSGGGLKGKEETCGPEGLSGLDVEFPEEVI